MNFQVENFWYYLTISNNTSLWWRKKLKDGCKNCQICLPLQCKSCQVRLPNWTKQTFNQQKCISLIHNQNKQFHTFDFTDKICDFDVVSICLQIFWCNHYHKFDGPFIQKSLVRPSTYWSNTFYSWKKKDLTSFFGICLK